MRTLIAGIFLTLSLWAIGQDSSKSNSGRLDAKKDQKTYANARKGAVYNKTVQLHDIAYYVEAFVGGGLYTSTFTNKFKPTPIIGGTWQVSRRKWSFQGQADLGFLSKTKRELYEEPVAVPKNSNYLNIRFSGLIDYIIINEPAFILAPYIGGGFSQITFRSDALTKEQIQHVTLGYGLLARAGISLSFKGKYIADKNKKNVSYPQMFRIRYDFSWPKYKPSFYENAHGQIHRITVGWVMPFIPKISNLSGKTEKKR